jgi:rubrerythrin
LAADEPTRECPLCGETMRLHERELSERVPGTSEFKTRKTFEWVCPECDYFEDFDAPRVEGG